ncbi:hypothetical protein CRENBAI_009277 [Crenichthys baileyi]|uniref:Uncharacterized protein n=1 Tax=Crenichthys baileyi TaxID=28760 RepID=A0AAV9R8H6_9TELE
MLQNTASQRLKEGDYFLSLFPQRQSQMLENISGCKKKTNSHGISQVSKRENLPSCDSASSNCCCELKVSWQKNEPTLKRKTFQHFGNIYSNKNHDSCVKTKEALTITLIR